jgi:hypothetical protein
MIRTRFLLILACWVLVTFCVAASMAKAETPPLSACVQAAAPQYEYLLQGRHVAFICTDAGATKAYPAGLSCLHSACNPSAFAAAVVRVATAGDYKKAIDADWSANVKWTCDAPPDPSAKDLCDERWAWIATNWDAWTKDFSPAVWRVKANGTATTRPAYALANGVLGTKEVARATVGTPCDLSKPTIPALLGDVRAEFGTSGVVTICTKQAKP